MSAAFYEMGRLHSPRNWHLQILRDARGSDGAGYHWRDLTWARHVDIVPPLEVAVKSRGLHLDVTFDIGAGAPILSARAARTVRDLAGAEVEFFPARLAGESAEYFVLNVLSLVKCVDEQKTQYIEKWTKDSVRPDREGEYKVIWGIVIDPELAAGNKIFRIWGSYSADLIVSRDIKQAFERERFTGVNFSDVCSPK